jgi:hypothetical protein
MAVADEIAAVPRYNASTTASAWTDLPLTAADLADPDDDGLPNLPEYAFGASPLSASGPALTLGRAGQHLTLAYVRIADPMLTYTVESADSLAGPWSTITTEGNPSTGAANVAGTVTITDPAPLSEHPRRFLLLRVQR